MEGERDIWATAVALALLEVAHRDRRPFELLCFDGEVKFEATVPIGGQLPEQALFVGCSGGTSIATALARGLDTIRANAGGLRKADVVLITDGGSDTDPAPALRGVAQQLNVSILGIGIGVRAEVLQPWCDLVQVIADLASLNGQTADALFGL